MDELKTPTTLTNGSKHSLQSHEWINKTPTTLTNGPIKDTHYTLTNGSIKDTHYKLTNGSIRHPLQTHERINKTPTTLTNEETSSTNLRMGPRNNIYYKPMKGPKKDTNYNSQIDQ